MENELLQKILDGINALKPLVPQRKYDFKKLAITTAASQQFNFDWVPVYFVVYIQFSTGLLAALYREGAFVGLSVNDSDAIPLFDGFFFKVPARERVCTIHNLSGTTINVWVFALGEGVELFINQAK